MQQSVSVKVGKRTVSFPVSEQDAGLVERFQFFPVETLAGAILPATKVTTADGGIDIVLLSELISRIAIFGEKLEPRAFVEPLHHSTGSGQE